MYGEDIDLSWRIRKAGYFNYYLPDVRIIHYKGRSAMQRQGRLPQALLRGYEDLCREAPAPGLAPSCKSLP